MPQQARRPRQREGEELVAIAIMVPASVKVALGVAASQDRRSVSRVGRIAIEAYLHDREHALEARHRG